MMSIHDGSLERLEQLLGVYATDPDVDMDAATVEMIERLTAENERLKAFIADKIHDATVERMMLEVK